MFEVIEAAAVTVAWMFRPAVFIASTAGTMQKTAFASPERSVWKFAATFVMPCTSA